MARHPSTQLYTLSLVGSDKFERETVSRVNRCHILRDICYVVPDLIGTVIAPSLPSLPLCICVCASAHQILYIEAFNDFRHLVVPPE